MMRVGFVWGGFWAFGSGLFTAKPRGSVFVCSIFTAFPLQLLWSKNKKCLVCTAMTCIILSEMLLPFSLHWYGRDVT